MCDIAAPCHTSGCACVLFDMTSTYPTGASGSITPTNSARAPIDRPDWLSRDVWPFTVNTLLVAGPDGPHRVAYTDVGSGPTLLFSHAGQWSFVWRDVIVDLADDFRCIAYDSLGSGLSDRVPAGEQRLDGLVEVG